MSALDLRTLLNPEQFRAATVTEGPLLILAGAGSGKTRVLVHRIAHLLETKRAEPWQIFAVTFTNKAAKEMRDRLERLMGPAVRQAWIGTFHSLSARILRLEAGRLGFNPSFTIYDADDSRRLLKSVLTDMGHEAASKSAMVNGVAVEIERAKNAIIDPTSFAQAEGPRDTPQRRAARRAYPKYQQALLRSNSMDFGDLLMWAVILLRDHQEARHRFGRRFRHVLVDEFQDTNRVQYELLKLLVEEHRNLCVVGDDDQAIYRWRGADVTNILGFSGTFSEATVVKLETNYRSTANILAAANAVISRNERRHPKQLRTESGPGQPVRLAMLARSEEEAQLVAQAIKASDRSYREFAVLYRSNAQSRLFEEVFMRTNIPYTLVGGTGFYGRMEVKDILAYLRVVANPSSRADFTRIVNTPTRGIGAKTVERLTRAGQSEGLDASEALRLPGAALRSAGISASATKKLQALGGLFEKWRDLSETASAVEVATRVIEDIQYIEYLEKSDPTTAEERAANVSELVSSIAEFEEQLADASEGQEGLGLAGARTPLQAFLDGAALVTPDDQQDEKDRVVLMTLHSAKGLEFPVVFMVGMEERTFPSQRAVDDLEADALEEERRLCYVGMTRAQRELILTAARFRRIYGREEVRLPSRFLGELPDGLVETMPGTVPWEGRNAGEPSGEHVEYDLSFSPEPDPYHRPQATLRGGSGELQAGSRVLHNTFGEGIVLESDGGGADARLTIDFPDSGTKRVVARFVKPL
ncbi:MAG: ATP-dependent helicase [Myxococcota bacterium]